MTQERISGSLRITYRPVSSAQRLTEATFAQQGATMEAGMSPMGLRPPMARCTSGLSGLTYVPGPKWHRAVWTRPIGVPPGVYGPVSETREG
jgi:hypothetical protein